jgi:hypothetical protein
MTTERRLTAIETGLLALETFWPRGDAVFGKSAWQSDLALGYFDFCGTPQVFVGGFGTRPFCPVPLGHDVRLSEIIAFEQQRLT